MRTLLALCLLLGACGHHRQAQGLDAEAMRRAEAAEWPKVRIDQPEGARFVMERGIFGEGVDAVAPFQGQFQPSGPTPDGGYTFTVSLDAAQAKRYGGEGPVTLTAYLRVRERPPRGVLRLSPSDCALRALIDGDLDSLDVEAEELPTADVVCAQAAAAAPGATGGHASCPHHGAAQASCPHGDGACGGGMGRCGDRGGHGHCGMRGHGRCGMHGGKHRCGRGGRDVLWAPALLTLRVKR